MITLEGVIGIDQQVNAIGDASGRERYLKSLADFCSESAHGNTTAASTKRISRAIQDNCGVELNEASLQTILKGSMIVFQRIKDDKDSLTSALKALDNKMRGIFGQADADTGLSHIEKMTDFLVECVETVASAS